MALDFKKGIIIVTAISAAIMELIDTSIVNVALSQISGNLGATIEDTSWVITAYAIANVIIIPLTGFLAKYFGRKNYYIASIILFTIASVMCGNSHTLWELVAWRFIQGIGGGALLSTSQSILFDTFPPEKRGMASGLFGMGIVLGPTIGPILGGVIVDNYSWPLIFYINIPFGILATYLSYTFIEKKVEEFNIDKKSINIDYLGIMLLMVGVGSLQYVLERGETEDWFESINIKILSLTGLIGLASFIYWELKTPNPAVNLRVLKSRNLIGSNILTFVCGFGLFGSVFIFPVFVQRILGYTPTDAGLGLIPGAMVAIFIMPIIGKNIQKGVSPIYFVVVGFIAFILHGYLSAQANPEVSREFFILPQICRGIGTACLTVPLINQAAIGLSPQELPYGLALTNMIRQLGGAFGIATMNTYITIQYAEHRNNLISNTYLNNPELTERLNSFKNGLVAKGYDVYSAAEAANKFIDLSITKQSYLLSYLDGFKLIGLFFIITIPFMFLLSNKKLTKQQQATVAEESH